MPATQIYKYIKSRFKSNIRLVQRYLIFINILTKPLILEIIKWLNKVQLQYIIFYTIYKYSYVLQELADFYNRKNEILQIGYHASMYMNTQKQRGKEQSNFFDLWNCLLVKHFLYFLWIDHLDDFYNLVISVCLLVLL